MVDTNQKVYENKLRRAAERQGFRLVKIGRRDTRAHDFGLWLVVAAMATLKPKNGQQRRGSLNRHERAVMPEPMTFGAIETWLSTPPAARHLAG
jgi:hypothetical protein